ncbi:hypothetical protein [Streptomyces cucumeris]|uniref:hypothetical protein n=1 Tax=Streptomyces cucumeris TaxID=2962890 RepID=UPI003D73BB5D
MAIGVDPRWFRGYAPAGAVRRRLVCLPHAGGSAGFFQSWGRAAVGGTLPSGVEVLTTRCPGRQERLEEPAVDRAAVAPAGFDLTVLPGDHFYPDQPREAVLRAPAAHLG